MPPNPMYSMFSSNLVSVTVRHLCARNSLLNSLLHIRDQIRRVLDTARNSDKIVKDTGDLPLLLRDAGVGHGAGDFDQALDAAEGFGEGEDLGVLAEALGGLLAALDAEAQHAAAEAVAVLLDCDFALLVRVRARVVDEQDVGVVLQGGADGGGVLGGLAGAQVEGLDAAVGEPAVEGRGDGADGVLQEGEALVDGVAVEGGDAHADVAVAVDVLCDRVDDDVGAVLERVLDVGGEEGVVNDDHDAGAVGDVGDGADVDEREGGVGGRLDPDELGVGGDQGLDVDLDAGGEGDLDAVGGGDLCEVTVGAAVDVGDGDDMAAGCERLQDDGGGGRAGGEGEGVLGLLKGGDAVLEVCPVGVGRAGVLVLADRVADGGLGKGGGQGDGLDHSTSGGVVRCTGVDGESAELVNRRGGPGRRLNGGVVVLGDGHVCE
jgi:hypothetical protein